MSAKLQPADRVIRFVERNGVWWWDIYSETLRDAIEGVR